MIVPLPQLQHDEYPHLTLRTVRAWAKDGYVPGAHQVRGRWYVDLDEFYRADEEAPQVSDRALAIARATA